MRDSCSLVVQVEGQVSIAAVIAVSRQSRSFWRKRNNSTLCPMVVRGLREE